jgi:hypothetical protein
MRRALTSLLITLASSLKSSFVKNNCPKGMVWGGVRVWVFFCVLIAIANRTWHLL